MADDPTAGSPSARFWEKEQNGGRDEMRYAAASLLAGATGGVGIEILKEGREKARSEGARLDFNVALAHRTSFRNGLRNCFRFHSGC
jgi:hypothetical protein